MFSFPHGYHSFTNGQCGEGWGLLVHRGLCKGWKSKGQQVKKGFCEGEFDVTNWGQGDIVTLRADFQRGLLQIRKNNGRYWFLPKLDIIPFYTYSFALHMTGGMTMRLLYLQRI